MLSFGPNELLAVFVLVFLLFGASKVPELARNLGKSIGEFRKARIESEKELEELNNVIK